MPHVSRPDRLSAAAGQARASAISAAEFRGAFDTVTTTVSVIATGGPAGTAGLTGSAVCVASDTPPLLIACVHGNSGANPVIRANGVMSVNCLNAGQTGLSQAFAGAGNLPMAQRFALGEWDVLVTGAPCCRGALATFDCDVVEVRDLGTHSMFVAQVVATRIRDGGEPLVYRRRAYATTRPL